MKVFCFLHTTNQKHETTAHHIFVKQKESMGKIFLIVNKTLIFGWMNETCPENYLQINQIWEFFDPYYRKTRLVCFNDPAALKVCEWMGWGGWCG